MLIPSDAAPLDRRQVISLISLSSMALVLSACSGGAKTRAELPDPIWPESGPGTTPTYRPTRTTSTRAARLRPQTTSGSGRASVSLPADVIPRSAWAQGDPVPRFMDRMRPIDRITLHHDGMTAFTSTGRADAAERIEKVREAHRNKGWGDIGYHFVVDPAGRVWEARPLSWQGAHVRSQNEGNIGVCVLGNYERQRPNAQQLAAVEAVVADLMRRYRIRLDNVHSHRELAPTLCPGRNLQPQFVAMRSSSGGLALV